MDGGSNLDGWPQPLVSQVGRTRNKRESWIRYKISSIVIFLNFDPPPLLPLPKTSIAQGKGGFCGLGLIKLFMKAKPYNTIYTIYIFLSFSNLCDHCTWGNIFFAKCAQILHTNCFAKNLCRKRNSFWAIFHIVWH